MQQVREERRREREQVAEGVKVPRRRGRAKGEEGRGERREQVVVRRVMLQVGGVGREEKVGEWVK